MVSDAPRPLASGRDLRSVVKARAPESEQRSRAERRAPERLRAGAGGTPEADPVADLNHFLPRHASMMAAFVAVAFAIAALVTEGLPSQGTGLVGLAALGLFAAGSLFAALERRAETGRAMRLLVLLVGVVTPMALAGVALAGWVGEGLPWQWAVATLLCINAATAALLEVRIISLFCAKIAAWSGFALISPGMLTLVSLVGVAITLALIARLEWKAAERRRLEREARERVAARAEDILRSFEETGQGWFWETDRRGLITCISPKAALVLGKSVEEVCGQPLSTIVDAGAGAVEAERTLSFHLPARSAFHDVEVRAATGEEERWWAFTGGPVYDS